MNAFADFASPTTLFDDGLRIVAAQAGELERLVVDQNQRAVVGREQGLEAGFGIAASIQNFSPMRG